MGTKRTVLSRGEQRAETVDGRSLVKSRSRAHGRRNGAARNMLTAFTVSFRTMRVAFPGMRLDYQLKRSELGAVVVFASDRWKSVPKLRRPSWGLGRFILMSYLRHR